MSKNWYPKIDENLCVKCGACIDFCKQGVYDKNNGSIPNVINAVNCIENCHGCGNICPTGAITYENDNAIEVLPSSNQKSSICGETSSCCTTSNSSCECSSTSKANENIGSKTNEILIDFLYLDLNTCERCMATGDTLDKALNSLRPVFEELNYVVKVNKVNIITRKLAKQHRFISSPTIRVNGIDICTELKESYCKDCCDLGGCSVDCRVFVYDGREYEQPPAAMIIDGILRVLYGQLKYEEKPYTLPDNLENYFTGRESIMKNMQIFEPAMCCDTGLCGVTINPELLRISTVLNTLRKNGVEIKRFNLNSAPMEFVNNKVVNDFINNDGVEKLPVVLLNGKIVISGRYPTNEEIIKLLSLPKNLIAEKPNCNCNSNSCDCNGGCC